MDSGALDEEPQSGLDASLVDLVTSPHTQSAEHDQINHQPVCRRVTTIHDHERRQARLDRSFTQLRADSETAQQIHEQIDRCLQMDHMRLMLDSSRVIRADVPFDVADSGWSRDAPDSPDTLSERAGEICPNEDEKVENSDALDETELGISKRSDNLSRKALICQINPNIDRVRGGAQHARWFKIVYPTASTRWQYWDLSISWSSRLDQKVRNEAQSMESQYFLAFPWTKPRRRWKSCIKERN